MRITRKPQKRSIRSKTIALLLKMTLATLAITGTAALIGLYSLKSISISSSRELGERAAVDAEEALKKLAGEQLYTVSEEKAAQIEGRFSTVTGYVNGIAALAERIYAEPDNYPDRTVDIPKRDNEELTVQLLRSRKLQNPTSEQYKELLKLGNIQDLLLEYNRNNDMVSSVYLATATGWVIQADYISYSKYSEGFAEPDYYEADTRQWYQYAMEMGQGETIYSDVMEDVHHGGDCIVCSQPVYYNGKIVAVVGIGSYLRTVNDAVLSTRIGDSGYALLLNQKGQVVVSPKLSGETAAYSHAPDLRSGDNEELAAVARDMTSGISGIAEISLDGREVYIAYAPLRKLGWSFATVMDVDEVIAPATKSEHEILSITELISAREEQSIHITVIAFLFIATLATVVIVTTGTIFAGRLTEPIHRLIEDVQQMDGGNLEHRVKLKTGDELETLGHAFNKMTSRIQEHVKTIATVTAEKERIRTEIQVASRLQADMLPEAEGAFSNRREFSLYAAMTPAKGVGGDFYDFFLLDEDHLVLVMADVAGKGVPAALFMVVSRTTIRGRLLGNDSVLFGKGSEQGTGLADAIAVVNDSLCANNKNDMFVTAWVGVLNLSTGVLDYVNAGHCRPLIRKRDGNCVLDTNVSGFVLAGMEETSYKPFRMQLLPEDTIILYTDGITEATSTKMELYGEQKLKTTVEQAGKAMPKELLACIWNDVNDFQAGAEQFDDITMLAITWTGKGKKEMTEKAEMEHSEAFAKFLEDELRAREVSQKTISSLLVALDEMISNVCRYSGASEVTVGVETIDNPDNGNKEVVLYISDDGTPFNPLDWPEPDVEEPLEGRTVGGLGIYITRKRADRMNYHYTDGKNCLSIMQLDKD